MQIIIHRCTWVSPVAPINQVSIYLLLMFLLLLWGRGLPLQSCWFYISQCFYRWEYSGRSNAWSRMAQSPGQHEGTLYRTWLQWNYEYWPSSGRIGNFLMFQSEWHLLHGFLDMFRPKINLTGFLFVWFLFFAILTIFDCTIQWH